MAAELAPISLRQFESPDMKRPVAPQARSIYALARITHLLRPSLLFYSINGQISNQ
jgi:hypothetical protein